MKTLSTPLSTLLGLTTIAACAPDLLGHSPAKYDRRTHAPSNDVGHGPLNPTKMASITRGMTHAADGLVGAGGFKSETMLMVEAGDTGHITADKDASLGLDMESATGAAVFANIKLS